VWGERVSEGKKKVNGVGFTSNVVLLIPHLVSTLLEKFIIIFITLEDVHHRKMRDGCILGGEEGGENMVVFDGFPLHHQVVQMITHYST
jgi:hypothetical protein